MDGIQHNVQPHMVPPESLLGFRRELVVELLPDELKIPKLARLMLAIQFAVAELEKRS